MVVSGVREECKRQSTLRPSITLAPPTQTDYRGTLPPANHHCDTLEACVKPPF